MSFQSTRRGTEDGGLRTFVQRAVLGQEELPEGVLIVIGFVVERPCDVVNVPGLPDGRLVWREDLGKPHVPGGGEDRRSREEESS